MKLDKIKDEIRVIGIDDAPFTPHTKGDVFIFGVITRGNSSIEGIVQTKIEIDGRDGTQKLSKMITKTKHYGQIRVVLLNGITFGGFNIIDIDQLAEMIDRPVISLIEHEPNFDKIKIALKKHYTDWKERWNIFQRIKSIEKINIKANAKPIYFHYSSSDLNPTIVKEILEKTTGRSHIPESLKLAHLIGESFLKSERKKKKLKRKAIGAKKEISPEQAEILEALEIEIGKPLPLVNKIFATAFGIKLEGKMIVGLGLYKCGLETLPDNFGKLVFLQELTLQDNKLTTLPESICDLKLLTFLILHNNQLITLPKSFGNLKSLQVLELSDNELETLPESFGQLQSLQKLNLFKNPLKTLPQTFGDLSSLQELNSFQNLLTTLPASFGSLENLEELNLDFNKLNSLPNSIGGLQSLKTLKLQNNKLENLPESFINLQSLQFLDLRHNKFTTLPGPIWPLKNLKTLHMSENPLNEESTEVLTRDWDAVREFCRKSASINVFISHDWDDQTSYRILDLRNYLLQRSEIYEAFICEKDLVGDIQEFMDEKVPQSHLLLFIATHNSINSKACQHELALALTHSIEIIPLKGTDIDWADLNRIDLTNEGKDYFDLSLKKGFEFNIDRFDAFCDELYEYVKQFKREINLYEPQREQLEKIKGNIKEIFA
ncbi:MAG: DUF99 family protein, partial [Promethearchaeota archaeon]